jgi:hypothetical protein
MPIFVFLTMNWRSICTRMDAAAMMRKILEKEIVLSGEGCPVTMGWIPFFMNHDIVGKGDL